MLDLWAEKTPQQAHDTLELPDVTVTNQRDKAVQLSKVLSLNQTILREIGDWRRRAAANATPLGGRGHRVRSGSV